MYENIKTNLLAIRYLLADKSTSTEETWTTDPQCSIALPIELIEKFPLATANRSIYIDTRKHGGFELYF